MTLILIKSLHEEVDDVGPDGPKGNPRLTEGLIPGTKQGQTMTLETLNKRLAEIGLAQITPSTVQDETWAHDPESPGLYHHSFYGDEIAIPEDDGKYLYDIMIELAKVEPVPFTPHLLEMS